MQDSGCCITYQINHRDEIISVNEDWCRYASDYGWEGISPDTVLHRPIHNYITDTTTSRLYQYLFKRVREGSTVRYQFNCECISHHRLMEMTVMSLGSAGDVELKARLLTKHERKRQPPDTSISPSENEFLRACGWCYRIDMGGIWIEVEDAVAKMGVFEFSRLPKLTHGICKSCFVDKLAEASTSEIAATQNDPFSQTESFWV